MSVRLAAAIGFLLIIAGCGESTVSVIARPKEPDSHAIGHYCRMTLTEHVGPKGQILLKGLEEPLWFTSVHDAFTYVGQDLVNEDEMAGFWVNDMGKGSWEKPAPGSWIEAETALYVVESKKSAAMGGNEAVPFKEREPAEAFAKEFGGRIVDYRTALTLVAEAPPSTVSNGGMQ
jgi:copper chaperone NosL